ncbi:MAG: DUF2490 domain-containing protein [Pseudomonadota bacterium]
MRLRIAACAAAASLWVSGPAAAVDHEIGSWLIASTSGALGHDTRWRFAADTQARLRDPGSGTAQYLLRPSLGLALTDQLTGWLGFARFESRSASGQRAHENRYWQQLSWRPRPLGAGTIRYRLRLEQRLVSISDDDGLWLRLLARYERPLSGGKTLFVGAETFYDLRDTDWSGDAGPRQHRILFGIGWQLASSWWFEAGYLNQYQVRDPRANDSNHLLTLRLNHRF